MKKQWFKSKKYGIGFFPITIEGWMATLALMGLIFLSAYTNNFFISEAESAIGPKDSLRFLFDVIVLCCLFTVLFQDRLKDGLKWRWGNNQKDNGNTNE